MTQIILLIILVFLAAVTAASETSIIAASRIKLKRLAHDGSRTAKIILKILETPERFFGTILVANNIVDALIASIVTAIMIFLTREETKGVIYATAIVTFVIIVSEVAAKTLAAKHSERLALILARPVRFLIFVLSPVVKALSVIINFIVNIISPKVNAKPSLVTEEEIRALIKIGEEEGILHGDKYKMLSKVFKFSDTVAREIMVAREEIVSIDLKVDISTILNFVLESGYSRLPVYKDNPDNIIGVINMKDLLNLSVNNNLILLEDIIYPPMFVSGDKKVSELLKDFQKGHTHLAIVIDSQNRLEGLVTLEDILEEIVGEIKDEYDIRE